MAATFNGSSQYLSAGPAINLTAGANVSISYWMQVSSFAAERHALGRVLTTGYGGFSLHTKTSDDTQLGTLIDGDNDYTTTGWSAFGTNTWAHVLFVKTSGNRFKYYLNGTVKPDATGTALSYTTLNTAPLYVGATNGWNGSTSSVLYYFAGKIAELAIWTGTDMSAYVGELYTGAAAGNAPDNTTGADPDYYWKLIADANATIGATNLTENGTPTWDSTAHTGLTITYGGGAAAFIHPRFMLTGIG